MKYLFVLIIVFSLFTKVYGQSDGVEVIASAKKDSILLRWAPRNSYSWHLANNYGYIIKRYTIVKGKRVVKEVEEVVLTPEPIKPKPLQNWEPYVDDKFVSIAAECLFNSIYVEAPVGMNPHLAYKKYQEEQHRFGFAMYAADQSVMAAKLSGLYYADNTVDAKTKYLYRVFVNCPDTLAIDTASVFVGVSDFVELPKPLDLRAEWGDKKVDLSWDIKYLKHYYSAYFIEKSTDNGKSYFRISENNSVQVSDKDVNPRYQYKTDTLKDNKELVYYRVRGRTPFGETGPASDSVFGKGRLPLKGAPVLINEELIENKVIKLDWLYPEEMNDYITGFKIYRSAKPKQDKEVIYKGTNPQERSYIDSTPTITNYYFISAYNEVEEKVTPFHSYVQRIDSFPPAIPQNLIGEIDSTGGVHLSWEPNTDDDIAGYRVYRANNPKFEFSLVYPDIITDTQFVDSIKLKILNKNIYYRLRAIDQRDNQSAMSEILTLERPDIIAPVPPVIKNVSLNKKGHVELYWVNSSSSDVVNHVIYRKTDVDSVATELVVLPDIDSIYSTFIDETINGGTNYQYWIKARDESNNLSNSSNIGYIKVPSTEKQELKLKRRVLTDRVRLTWDITLDKQVKKVIVYRRIDDGKLSLLGYSESDEYVDDRLTLEKKYEYRIKVEFIDGSTSALSNTVTAKM